MANTQTLKQRFLDILFEDDDEEIIEEPKEKVVREAPRIKASDLLYGKKENSPLIIKDEPKKEVVKPKVEKTEKVENKVNNTFINYGEKTVENKPKEVKEKVEEMYISQPALSPIFGNVEKDKKKSKEEPISVDKAFVDKPNSNHLGIVLSPIYGYDSARYEEIKKEPVKKETYVDKDITTDLGDIFATDEFKKEAFNEDEETKTSEIDLFSDFYTTKD